MFPLLLHIQILLLFQLISNGLYLEVDQVLQALHALQSLHVFILDLIMLHQEVVWIPLLVLLHLHRIPQAIAG